MYSGLHPAMTPLMAIFSTVACAQRGGTEPITSSGLRLVAGEHLRHALFGRRYDRQPIGPTFFYEVFLRLPDVIRNFDSLRLQCCRCHNLPLDDRPWSKTNGREFSLRRHSREGGNPGFLP